MRVLLVTPLFPPLRGGAATYSEMLVTYMSKKQELDHLYVLTEYAKGKQLIDRIDINVTVIRGLPPQLSYPILKQMSKVFISCIGMLQIITITVLCRIDFIHWLKSALTQPRVVFSKFTKICPVLLDVRDIRSPANRLRYADHYIASSKNIGCYLQNMEIDLSLITNIPIPFERPESLTESCRYNTLKYYQLSEQNYILFVGDLCSQKGVPELLEGYKLLTAQCPRTPVLVLAGADHSNGEFKAEISTTANVLYLGPLQRRDILALMQEATCVILPSKGEALGRVILEAIAVGSPVICPPGVPEFEEFCPSQSLTEVTPHAIAAKLMETLKNNVPANYPLELHEPHHSMSLLWSTYLKMMEDLVHQKKQ